MDKKTFKEQQKLNDDLKKILDNMAKQKPIDVYKLVKAGKDS